MRQITIFPDLAKTSKAALALHVQLMLRGGADLYRDVAYCVDQGTGLVCDVPFDSGAFTLRPSDGALQLNVGPSGLIIEDSGGNGLVELSGTTGDDRVFRLMPVPQNGCF